MISSLDIPPGLSGRDTVTHDCNFLDTKAPAGRSEYRELTTRVRDAGLFERRSSYYIAKILLTVGAYGAGWAALFLLAGSWACLGVAVFLALVFTHLAFLGHDAGHHQVFRSHRANHGLGLVAGNLLIGLSLAWWVPKHNAHHAYPNQVGRDPDIGPGVIAFTPEVAHSRRRPAGRLLARWQAQLFFPLTLLEGVSLHLASVQTVRRLRGSDRVVEGGLLVVHVVAYGAAVFWLLSPVQALAFIAVQQGLFGLYLGATFAPNHKGMPILDHDDRLSFARRQVLTARNVTGGRLTTFMLGGLNYQIEHHLFPTMPCPNLRNAQPLVRAWCHEHGLPYTEESLVGSYRRALHHLRAVLR